MWCLVQLVVVLAVNVWAHRFQFLRFFLFLWALFLLLLLHLIAVHAPCAFFRLPTTATLATYRNRCQAGSPRVSNVALEMLAYFRSAIAQSRSCYFTTQKQ